MKGNVYLSPWGAPKCPGPTGVEVGENVPAEGREAKKGAYREDISKP